MTTPGVPVDLYSYCLLLQSEITRLTDRLDRLEYGTPAPPPAPPSPGPTFHGVWDGSRWVLPTIPAPTPAVIAAAHTSIPLAETFPPTAPDTVTLLLYACAHDTSGAQLRAYSDRAAPGERRVSIRGTDQQIGEALIALGKRFMRKRVRAKKQRQPPSAEGPAPPPPVAPVPASHATKMDVDRAPHRSSTVPRGQSQVPRPHCRTSCRSSEGFDCRPAGQLGIRDCLLPSSRLPYPVSPPPPLPNLYGPRLPLSLLPSLTLLPSHPRWLWELRRCLPESRIPKAPLPCGWIPVWLPLPCRLTR
ncbi:hypothetical protein MIND_01313000 [Mycena indigotica]|uniref:Uncharacterized protein n=1 Tax=Mycena indigotica TaxID=2126181 RepID=A0A8H6S1R0_9AGAR|nr:uncharacterized protein MIND_01313000 [Mycena indigotica]KAF7290723.1 hypothetical protein MIND_01313000 [Mycena indigotica]